MDPITSMRTLCANLPKAELHAHLAGCARLETIAEFERARSVAPGAPTAVGPGLTLDECFARFARIHAVLDSAAALRRVTDEVLADFAMDRVRYLELRTTPRPLTDTDARGYVKVVLAALVAFEATQARGAGVPMVARLLLSIDRSSTVACAHETVEIARSLRASDPDGARMLVGDF